MSMLRTIFANRPESKVTMTYQEYNAALNKARKEGYDLGYSKGREDMLFSTATPNQIREILGFDKVEE